MKDGLTPQSQALSAAILGTIIAAGMFWSTVAALVGLNIIGVI